jgi:hypothetical protein
MAEIPANSALIMDRGQPIGNTDDTFGRRAVHVKIGNKTDEPITITGNITAVSPIASSATLTSLASSTSTQTVLVANSNRRGFILVNESTANCYIAFAATTTTTAYTILLNANMTYQNEAQIYIGDISCKWSAVNGSLRITELLA